MPSGKGRWHKQPLPDWRLPTESELDAERQSWSSDNAAGAYASTLKWPVGGVRYGNGIIGNVEEIGFVWSASIESTYGVYMALSSFNVLTGSYIRAGGMSVRCVRDDSTTP